MPGRIRIALVEPSLAACRDDKSNVAGAASNPEINLPAVRATTAKGPESGSVPGDLRALCPLPLLRVGAGAKKAATEWFVCSRQP
jgi:hypothetical protein